MRLQLMKVSCNLKTEFPISERLLLKLRSVKKRGNQGQSFLFFSFLFCMAPGFKNYNEKRFKDVLKGIVTVAPCFLILFFLDDFLTHHPFAKNFCFVFKLIPDSALVTK